MGMTTKETHVTASEIKRNRARCRKCKDVIESLHRHHFVICKCGEIFVDGGKEYLRRGGDFRYLQEMSITVTMDELLEDE